MTRETVAFRSSAALVALAAAAGLVLQHVLLIGHAPATGSVSVAHGVLASCAAVTALFLVPGAVPVVLDGWRGRARAAVAAT